MDRVLNKIYMPFLLATLCTITGFVTAAPVPPTNGTYTVTDLVTETNFNSSVGSVIATSGTTQPQYATDKQSEAPTSMPNTSRDALNQRVNNGSQTAISPPASLPSTTVTTTTSSVTTTVAPPTTTASPRTVTVPTTPGFTTQEHTVTTVHSTRATKVATVPTTLHTSPTVLTSPKSPSTTQAPLVKTSATQALVSVHKTSPVVTTHTTSSSQGTFSTTSKSTHIPDNQTTKESGDWSIIGISGNSFTGKILLPIAVGTAFSVIIIAVAYCYCSRRGSKYTQAKSSRNGVHRMTSNDRVMLLADSSEDEF